MRVIYGRLKGARLRQEHFDSILRSEESRQRGFKVESHPKCPTLYHVRETDGLIELHVDDGHGCGKETVIAELLAFLSEQIEMKYVQGIWCGSYEYLKTMKVRDENRLTSIPNKKYLQSAMTKMGLSDCKGSVSPKLDKASMHVDNEEIDEEEDNAIQTLSAHSVESQQRENRHSKHGAFPVCEIEKPHSIEDAATDTISEMRQGYGRHGDSVFGA